MTELKIVSLLPSATEIIDCLGLTEALVGQISNRRRLSAVDC